MPDIPPLPPEILANTLQEPIHKCSGKAKGVRAVKSKKEAITSHVEKNTKN